MHDVYMDKHDRFTKRVVVMTQAVLLSKDAARALTVRIRESATNFGVLLLQAQEGEAWRALGYASWGAYVDGEFDFKRSRSYQLLTETRINRALGPEARPVTAREAIHVSNALDTGVAQAPDEVLRGTVERVRNAPEKPKAARRRGPPDLSSRLRDVRELLEWLTEQMEMAGDDALAYLDAANLREVERTASACYEWGEAMIAKLQEPRERRYIGESA